MIFQSSFDFQHIDSTLNNFNTLPQHNDSDLIMAVSANYKNKYSSGLHWSKCLANENWDLVPVKVETSQKTSQNITIQWSSQLICTSMVDGYNLTYCQIDESTRECLNEPVTIILDDDNRKYTINNLKPFTAYKMQMYMFSKKQNGPLGEEIIVQTSQEGKLNMKCDKNQQIY